MFHLILLAIVAFICDDAGVRQCEIAFGEFLESIPRDRCIAFSVECKTPIQIISCRIVSLRERSFITGDAKFLANVPNNQIAESPHSFCGRFVIVCDGKKHLRYHPDRYDMVDTIDPILPTEVAFTPKDWNCSPDLGDLNEFTRQIIKSARHSCKSTVAGDVLSCELVYQPAPDEGQVELEFGNKSRFLLNRFCFRSRSVAGSDPKPCFESQASWQTLSDFSVPSKRSDWRYSSDVARGIPYREAKFADFAIVDESELLKDIPDSSLPFGTLRTTIRNGSVQRRFVGGSRGESEFYMRSLAFQIRTKLGRFHDGK